MKKLNDYRPAGHLGTKRMGELAELAFMYRAASEGIGVAKPYGDSHPYDFLVQHGRKLFRVQVKSCFSIRPGSRGLTFSIIVCHRAGRAGRWYSPEEIDFIAAYVGPYQAWNVIPVEALTKTKQITLCPGGKPRRRTGRYEIYREAWHLLKDESHFDAKVIFDSTPEKFFDSSSQP